MTVNAGDTDRRSHDLAIAEAIAPTWVSRRADIERVAEPLRTWMVRHLKPQPEDTVLELAAGVGDTGFEAASMLGEQGHLICSDLSPTMVDAARRHGAGLGITNADYRVFDAQHIPLDDDAVDGVLCRLAFMLIADPAAALRETRRVLRPGGRLVLGVWGSPEHNPFFTVVVQALVRRGYLAPPPPPPAPGVFALADSERTAALIRAAGFDTVRIEEVTGRFTFPDAEAYLSMIADTAGPIALALRDVTGAERAVLGADVADALAPFADAGEYRLPYLALGVVAS